VHLPHLHPQSGCKCPNIENELREYLARSNPALTCRPNLLILRPRQHMWLTRSVPALTRAEV